MFLKVDSAYPEDQGRGKARLDPDTMLQLRLSPGDLVYIEGKRRTVAKVWRMMVNDWNQGKIRIDSFTRDNADVKIGDRVEISKVLEVVEAKKAIIAPPVDLRQLSINENQAKTYFIDFPMVSNDTVPVLAGMPFGQPPFYQFKAIEIEPENAVIITEDTEVRFSDKPAAGFEGVRYISYEDIGGLKGELQRVRETIELPMRHPELFRKLGIDPPKGVLLYGPPGTGKTLIAKAVANESGANFIPIAGPEVISKYYGESEQRLREIFEEAQNNAPSIIFIDELDSIAPKREEVTGEVERRVVAQLLTMMDGLEERGQVVVIGATNRLDAIDPALRRPGRFDREIEIGVPNEEDRLEVLHIHTRGMPLEGESKILEKRREVLEKEPELDETARADLRDELSILEDDVTRIQERFLEDFAARTTGFVGADLAALAREAAMKALRRYMPEIDLEMEEIPSEMLESMEVTIEDFRDALREVHPSAMREVFLEVSHITWNEVGGLESEKEEVREAVEYPLTRRGRFDRLGIEPPRGVLLYGPPGTGKTLIAKAVANESGANFIPVRGPQLLSKWVGESERAVREVFRKARQVSPSIIFFDEMDALAPARGSGGDTHVIESVVNQILTEMDGLEDMRGVVVMGATNRPELIDPALLRAGRFDRLIYIGEPDRESRKRILDIHTRAVPLKGSTIDELIRMTEGLDESKLEDLLEAMGDRMIVTIDDLKAQLSQVGKNHGEPLSLPKRREIILESMQSGLPQPLQLVDPARDSMLNILAERTDGYVGSDLELLCREAAMIAMRNKSNQVDEEHFEAALAKVHPMMNERLREHYRRILQHFKGGLPAEIQPPEYQ
jgi:transitional endoplasmic reticulum ATPase